MKNTKLYLINNILAVLVTPLAMLNLAFKLSISVASKTKIPFEDRFDVFKDLNTLSFKVFIISVLFAIVAMLINNICFSLLKIVLNSKSFDIFFFKYFFSGIILVSSLIIDDNLLRLSKEKFSSNVIDKFIIKDYEPSTALIQSIINKNIIKDIIVDQYGNYVVQKALNVSDRGTCEKIFEQIKPMLGELQKTNIGKKIYEKLWQHYKDFFD